MGLQKKGARGAPLVAALVTATALIATGPGAYASSRSNITATYMNSGTYNVAAQSLVGSFDKTTGVNVKIDAFPYAALQQNNTNAVISGQCSLQRRFRQLLPGVDLLILPEPGLVGSPRAATPPG